MLKTPKFEQILTSDELKAEKARLLGLGRTEEEVEKIFELSRERKKILAEIEELYRTKGVEAIDQIEKLKEELDKIIEGREEIEKAMVERKIEKLEPEEKKYLHDFFEIIYLTNQVYNAPPDQVKRASVSKVKAKERALIKITPLIAHIDSEKATKVISHVLAEVKKPTGRIPDPQEYLQEEIFYALGYIDTDKAIELVEKIAPDKIEEYLPKIISRAKKPSSVIIQKVEKILLQEKPNYNYLRDLGIALAEKSPGLAEKCFQEVLNLLVEDRVKTEREDEFLREEGGTSTCWYIGHFGELARVIDSLPKEKAKKLYLKIVEEAKNIGTGKKVKLKHYFNQKAGCLAEIAGAGYNLEPGVAEDLFKELISGEKIAESFPGASDAAMTLGVELAKVDYERGYKLAQEKDFGTEGMAYILCHAKEPKELEKAIDNFSRAGYTAQSMTIEDLTRNIMEIKDIKERERLFNKFLGILPELPFSTGSYAKSTQILDMIDVVAQKEPFRALKIVPDLEKLMEKKAESEGWSTPEGNRNRALLSVIGSFVKKNYPISTKIAKSNIFSSMSLKDFFGYFKKDIKDLPEEIREILFD